LVKEGLDHAVMEHLQLSNNERIDMTDWEDLRERWANPKGTVEIAVVGKYIELHDAYKSIYEALMHGGAAHQHKVIFRKVAAEDCADGNIEEMLDGVSGLLVPGGFGERGLEGKIRALRWARENQIPAFGICFGMQAMVLEYARHVAGIPEAHTSEVNPDCADPVIHLLESQEDVTDKGGTMRLGAYACRLIEGTKTAEVYGRDMIFERHRHRWEYNNAYRDRLEKAGLVSAGIHEKEDLVEVVEVQEHPFYVGAQYHPEFKSKPLAPHPLFTAFVGAAIHLQATPATADAVAKIENR